MIGGIHVKPNQTKPNQTKPNQTKPNQTKPNQTKPNQTKRNHCLLTVFLVGLMGFMPALGQVHQPQEDCNNYPVACFNECVELNACRRGSPIGSPGCWSEEGNLRFCRTTPPNLDPDPPVIIVLPKPKPVVTYHAGKCQKSGLFEFAHADVQSYKMVDGKKTMQSTSGFYPKDRADARKHARFYMWTARKGLDPVVVFTAGKHIHTATTDCSKNISKVSEDKFNKVRTLASLLNWEWFHHIRRNSVHWSDDVLRVKSD